MNKIDNYDDKIFNIHALKKYLYYLQFLLWFIWYIKQFNYDLYLQQFQIIICHEYKYEITKDNI